MNFFRLWCLAVVLAVSGASVRANPSADLEQALDATLILHADDGAEAFLGSGFLYGGAGLALTNAHVVGDAVSVLVKYRDGTQEIVPVLARDPARDIAVLRVNTPRPGLISADQAPPIGTPVIALGAPLGLGFTASRGIVAADPRQVDPAVPLNLLQHDAAINPGSSGGPLIDPQGRLLGMNSQIADGSRLFVGISYAIPAADLDRLVPPLLAGTLRPVPTLGIDVRPVTRGIALALDIPSTGLLIDSVQPDSLAARAGFRAGDIVLRVAGQPLDSPGALAYALDLADTITRADLLRDTVSLTLTLDLTPQATATPGPALAQTLPTLPPLDADNRVTDLPPDSLAARSGLGVGDRILRVNGQPLPTDATPSLLLVERDGRTLHIVLDPQASRRAPRPLGGNALDLSVRRF